MNVKILKAEDALVDGADLWVLPSLQVSEWTRQLDWPLNLMVTRAHHHIFPELPAQLKKITTEIEMKIPAPFVAPDRPLLVASEGRLPNRVTAVIYETNADQWLKSAVKVWKDLLKPQARFFLPAFAPWDQIKSSWPKDADVPEIAVVESGTVRTEEQA